MYLALTKVYFTQCCGMYCWIWIVFLPRIGGYVVTEENWGSEDGIRNKQLVYRYKRDDERSPLSLLGFHGND